MNSKSRQESFRNNMRRNSMVVTDIVINPNEPDLEMTNIGDSRKSRKGNSNSRNKQLGSVNILNTLSSFDTEENSKSDSKSSGRNTRNLLKRNKVNLDELSEVISSAFKTTHCLLVDQIFDCQFSGTTTVSVIVNNKNLYIANSGDSRAIVGRQLSDCSWESFPLSNDHKPDLEEEKERIINSGGRIFPFRTADGK